MLDPFVLASRMIAAMPPSQNVRSFISVALPLD
jgi:hypothetical protein